MSTHDHAPKLGLTEDCPRCVELAVDPTQIDDEKIRWIWESDWHRLGSLDRVVRERLTKAINVCGMLSQAFEYADYDAVTGGGKKHPKLNYTELYLKRGIE